MVVLSPFSPAILSRYDLPRRQLGQCMILANVGQGVINKRFPIKYQIPDDKLSFCTFSRNRADVQIVFPVRLTCRNTTG